jgi:hypothetical protein
MTNDPSRRDFLGTCAILTVGAAACQQATMPPPPVVPPTPAPKAIVPFPADAKPGMVGPREGYTPFVGTLVSMMAFMRAQVVNSVKSLKQEELDFLIDEKANRIGALLLHLAATERVYQAITFGWVDLEHPPEEFKQAWEIPMELGEPARKAIIGHDVDFYLKHLEETRQLTLDELKKRDDAWLMAVDEKSSFVTTTFAKWFHVVEHEANHNGQIKFLKGRLPGAKPAGE